MSSHTVSDLLLNTCRLRIFLSVSGCVALVKSWSVCGLWLRVCEVRSIWGRLWNLDRPLNGLCDSW